MLVLTLRFLLFCSVLSSLFNSFEALKISGKAWLADNLIEHAWARSKLEASRLKPWPWADFSPQGELIVPRIDERQIFLSGDNGNVLAFGPGINLTGAMPGDIGTSLIGGHRDTHFGFLQDLVVGDEIILTTLEGTFSYRVSKLKVVDSLEYSISAAAGNWLVLSTCFPFNTLNASDSLRYLVIAEASS